MKTCSAGSFRLTETSWVYPLSSGVSLRVPISLTRVCLGQGEEELFHLLHVEAVELVTGG
jgi:hypothetical protein